MAITKLLRLKESIRGSPSAHLKHNLEYICNPDKCEGGIWIGGNAGTRPEIIYDTMIQNKRFWGKEDGSQGFHYVISFPPELNVTEDMAFKIAEDFAGKLLGSDFYYAFVVHNDQHHMHVHITFDSVSRTDGHKYHSPKGDWEKRIQPITDEICKKYGLPVLEFTQEKKGKSYGQWKSDKEKSSGNAGTDVTWYNLIRDDIDMAVDQCGSFEEVLDELSKKGYEVKLGKYLSLRPFGRERPVRTSRLGDGYTVDAIKERILFKDPGSKEKDFIRYGNREEIIAVLKIKKKTDRSFSMTPFQRSFYRRWENSFLRNKPGRKDPWKVNADVIRVRKLSDAVKFMIDEEITDLDLLEEKWKEAQGEKERLRKQRTFLQDKLYRRSPLKEYARYKKLVEAQEDASSPEDEEELSHLRKKIGSSGGMEEAALLYGQIKDQLSKIKEEEKELRAREHLLDDLYTFYFDMPHPEPAKEKTEGEKKTKRWERERTRVTIHTKLIIRKNDDGSYLVRLPGKNERIRLPAEDTFLYKSGEILSAFIYDDEDYEIYRDKEQLLRKEEGSVSRTHFDRQRDREKEKVR